MTKVPTFDQLMNPLITAVRDLGGSGSIDEIYERVIQNLNLPEEVLSVLHDPAASNHTEVYYRLAWARTYLKKFGVLTNSTRGIWALAKPDVTAIDPKNVVRTVRENDKKDKQAKTTTGTPTAADETEAPEEAQTWRAKLYHILTVLRTAPKNLRQWTKQCKKLSASRARCVTSVLGLRFAGAG
jgi:restriction system protein